MTDRAEIGDEEKAIESQLPQCSSGSETEVDGGLQLVLTFPPGDPEDPRNWSRVCIVRSEAKAEVAGLTGLRSGRARTPRGTKGDEETRNADFWNI
jgi:hypothetical protein